MLDYTRASPCVVALAGSYFTEQPDTDSYASVYLDVTDGLVHFWISNLALCLLNVLDKIDHIRRLTVKRRVRTPAVEELKIAAKLGSRQATVS